MILAFYRALLQAGMIGIGTLGLILASELALTARLPDLTLVLVASLAVTLLAFLVRLFTLLRQKKIADASSSGPPGSGND
ncbi:MAG: hypothetical protein R3296_04435 [Oleiphilaceae bacterium]|nr:hypothetical protein [Oleiphilaceae bacterium]